MIQRIELKNFMSHEHTVIEPAAGLTVLVGPNNCGKSAVVAALQILCHNDNSTYVLRHGQKECSVKVETSDGHTIEWRRKTSPSYLIDGVPFDRLGRGAVPPELHPALRMPRVDSSGDTDFDVHFGAQKSPIFLLGSSPANSARFFASSSDAIQLVQIQTRHKEKLKERQRYKNQLEAESKQLTFELESLLPVPDLERRLLAAELLQQELQDLSEQIFELEESQYQLAQQQFQAARHRERAGSLAPLVSPPELSPTQPLEQHIDELIRAQHCADRARAEVATFSKLESPPELFDVGLLAAAIDKLAIHQQTIADDQQRLRALAKLQGVPALPDPSPLAACIGQIADQLRIATESRDRLQALRALPPLPELADIEALTSLVSELSRVVADLTVATSRHGVLATLAQPPEVKDDLALSATIAALVAGLAEQDHWRQAVMACAALPEPPAIAETLAVENLVRELNAATADRQTRHAFVTEVARDLEIAREAICKAAATAICPTCGAPLDAERLLSGALVDSQEHQHA